jgi:urea transport system permease protein
MKKNIPMIIIGLVLFSAPLFFGDFRLNLLGKYLSLAIVALAIDLIWGYAGILSLGHAVFFGLGAYCMGAYLKLQGEALPDFMVWCGLTELPWFWKPFTHAWFALPMTIILPVVLALLIGVPTFRVGIKGVYFSILTQALALIFVILFIGQQSYTGGTNGITNLQQIFGFSISEPGTMRGLYLVTVVLLGLTYVMCRALTNSRLGRILVATRDSENRLKFLGYNTTNIKLFVFAVSAGLAGLAGAIFVPQVGIISPSMMGILPSVEMAMWVAIGGRATLSGAILGAILVNASKSYLSESFPGAWLYFLGALYIVVVLIFPQGIMGFIKNIKRTGTEHAAAGNH